MQSDFAQGFVNSMLGWMRSLAAAVANMFKSGTDSQSGGSSMLQWFGEHWLGLLIALVLLGIITDWVVWMLRWRPYWLWFKKRRIVVDDMSDEPVYYEPQDRFHSRALRYDGDDYDDDGEYDDDRVGDEDYEDERPERGETSFDDADGDENGADVVEFDDDEIIEDAKKTGAGGLFEDGAAKRGELSSAKRYAAPEDDAAKRRDLSGGSAKRYAAPEDDASDADFDADEYFTREDGFSAKDCAVKSRKARRREKGGRRDGRI